MRKTLVSTCLLAITALSGPTVLADDELVVYSGRSDKFVKPVVEAFTAETGIKVTLHNAESTALLNKLRLEGEHSAADVFISNDAGNLQLGADSDLFMPLPEAVTADIPAQYRAADNNWVGLSARARVLVINTQTSDLGYVKSVFDLADPRLKGRLAITNSTNESYIAGTTVYLQAAGRERVRHWLQGMKDNAGNEVFAKHSKIVNAVAEGRKALGLVNHYYVYRHLAKHPDAPIRILLPDQGENGMGIAWNVAGAAVVKHTHHQEAAIRFLTFLTSPAGQKLFAEVNREYPTRLGIPAAAEVPPLDSYRVAQVPMYQLGKERNTTIDLIEAVGMP
jgi:iron(III) transport system substrate-binding protein